MEELHIKNLKKLNISILTVLTLMLVVSSSFVNAEENSEYSMDPGTEFYEYESFKSEDVDILGGEDYEMLIEQLDEEIVIENDDETSSHSISQFSLFSDEAAAMLGVASSLTMGFLEPVAGTGVNGTIYSDSKGLNTITYIAADIAYTGVIPFIDFKDGHYRVLISGVDGWIKATGFKAYAVNTPQIKVNHYTPEDGKLMHYISRRAINTTGGYSYDGIGNGDAPEYLKNKVDVFSADGHYFYANAITMMNDYKNNTRKNAINPNKPHYNYYQFLSYRTQSNFTPADLDGYLKNYKGYTAVPTSTTKEDHESMLVGSPQYFFDLGKKYGANPLMTFALAINESGWGRSNIAINKKNLFGHAAYDSSPNSATGYKTVAEGIAYHNQYYINNLYLNTNGGIYHGGYFGNKASGMNVKYASDPHWGEKAASNYHALNTRMGNKDTNKTEIGIMKTGISEINVRKEARTNSEILYTLKFKKQAVNILGSVVGQETLGSNVWYKISSDALLDSNRNVIRFTNGEAIPNEYDHSKNYAYIHSSLIDKVNDVITEEIPPPVVVMGDANGDGKVNLLDVIRTHKYYTGPEKVPDNILPNIDFFNDGNIKLVHVIRVHKIYKEKS